ncbi:hypothetical protein A1A1_16323 [Planococcus antarcticus DSM 14505]|uniref:Uncharacterized protein n=1 Tax=Planococcus antarcticus DSM 14505 TaxID=1185653 RepID=A0AA87IIM4_9BACL|nr:hypothetical protein [Planococcus antarcticus]EIM05410.1 hypothetical protein A1A1_16323 [Planococcus antarcticus DSM 14505]
MIKFAVIQSIELSLRWDELLNVALGLADEFSVVFPNGEYAPENFLLNGRPEFESVSDLKVSHWLNMEDNSIYFGSLDDSIRKLIMDFNHQAPAKDMSYLWHYSLYRHGIELLNVQDFTVCLLDLDTELTAHLQQLQINWRDE